MGNAANPHVQGARRKSAGIASAPGAGRLHRLTADPIDLAYARSSVTFTLARQGWAVPADADAGDLALGQAAQLLAGLGALAKLIETDELSARVAALEANRGKP
jgi:hypothetical protein